MWINKIRIDVTKTSLHSLPTILNNQFFNLTEVLAANNSLVQLKADNLGDHVKTLDLRNNQLKHLDNEVFVKFSGMHKIMLGGNPWTCDCSTLEFFNAIKVHKKIIIDFENIVCENLNKKISDLESIDVCFETIYIIAIGAVILALVGVIAALFYKYKKDIKIFLYAHNMCLWFVSEDELDEDKIYDAFVCFAADDQPIVEDIIFGLESEPHNFKCLVGVRDWEPGRMFTELVT